MKMKSLTAAVLSVIFTVLTLTGCSGKDEAFVSKNYTADGNQTKKVVIDVRDREIEVLPSSDSKIHIDYFESEKEYFSILASDDDVLTMTSENKKEWNDYIGKAASGENKKITLKIPANLLSSLTLSTTNENISLSGVNVKDSLSIFANGGDIIFDKLNAVNSIALESKNGNVKGTVIGSYDDYAIECKIKKGNSNLPESKESGGKKLSVSANNGDVTVDFIKS